MFKQFLYFSSEQLADFRHFIAENRQNIELITSRLLLVMGFKLHSCGTIYLREAICCYRKMPKNKKVCFGKTIYEDIAQQHASNAHNVSKDIRSSIQTCHANGRLLAFNEIYGCEIFSPNYPPTNSEFIVNVVEWMRSLELELSK